jgi:hypothetical protein
VDGGGEVTLKEIFVNGHIPGILTYGGFLPGDFVGGWPGIPFRSNVELIRGKEGLELHMPDPEPESPSVEHPLLSSVPPQNPQPPSIDPSHPTTTAEFIIAGNMIEHGNTMDTTPAISPIDFLSGGIAGLARSSIGSVAAKGLAPEIVATFQGGKYTSTVLRESMTAYRYSGGVSSAGGRFLTTADTVTQISSPAAASIVLRLPVGATAETLNTFTIPAGTRIFTGGVAGGADTATQIFIEDPSVLVPYP